MIRTRNFTVFTVYKKTKKKTTFWSLFYGWGSTVSRLELLRGGSFLFTPKFPEFPGIHMYNIWTIYDGFSFFLSA